jgi:hypothetical protein
MLNTNAESSGTLSSTSLRRHERQSGIPDLFRVRPGYRSGEPDSRKQFGPVVMNDEYIAGGEVLRLEQPQQGLSFFDCKHADTN